MLQYHRTSVVITADCLARPTSVLHESFIEGFWTDRNAIDKASKAVRDKRHLEHTDKVLERQRLPGVSHKWEDWMGVAWTTWIQAHNFKKVEIRSRGVVEKDVVGDWKALWVRDCSKNLNKLGMHAGAYLVMS